MSKQTLQEAIDKKAAAYAIKVANRDTEILRAYRYGHSAKMIDFREELISVSACNHGRGTAAKALLDLDLDDVVAAIFVAIVAVERGKAFDEEQARLTQEIMDMRERLEELEDE